MDKPVPFKIKSMKLSTNISNNNYGKNPFNVDCINFYKDLVFKNSEEVLKAQLSSRQRFEDMWIYGI